MKQPRLHTRWYLLADLIACIIAWNLFYFARKKIIGEAVVLGPYFYLGQFLFPIGWMTVYTITGAYGNIYTKSKVVEFFHVLLVSLAGSMLFMFTFTFKDATRDSLVYTRQFATLITLMVVIVYFLRVLVINKASQQIIKNQVHFNTLIVGNAQQSEMLFKNIVNNKEKIGFNIVGYINTNGKESEFLNNLGAFEDIDKIIATHQIEEVLVSLEKTEREKLEKILHQLANVDVNIKITPDRVDILSGAVRTTNIMGIPLIDLHSGLLPSWQQNIKRVIDIGLAFFALVLLSPLLLFTIIRILLDSKGSLFYTQERLGFKGKPFKMYKFRSMVANAEQHGPQLSSEMDPRITKWGKFMRKWRIDELPQLVNIIKGEMSLVGPRPERAYFAEQIINLHPEYKFLFKAKPGLSSWGMVQFGYAENVAEMIERMHYDLIYIENASLLVDFKIMLYTIKIIWSGKGK